MKYTVKLYVLFALLLCVNGISAQQESAKQILEQAASAFKNAGGISATFTVNADGNSASGKISMSGQKYVCTIGGNKVWFDGKTMWTYVKENEEVNVTTPTAAEVAKMNPYSFLTLYKNGYDAAKGKSTAKYDEVVLTSKGKGSYSKIIVRLDKTAHYPLHVHLQSGKNSTVIDVNSFLKNQTFQNSTFKFNKSGYPNVDVIDLR